MRDLILLTTMLISLNSSYARQELAETKPEFARFKIGLTVTPEMGYRIISLKKEFANIPFYQERVKIRNENDMPNLGFSAGVIANYNFSRKIGMEIGLQFANRGYTEVEPMDVNIDPSIALEAPYFGKFPVAILYKKDVNYLELPLRVLFSSGKGKLKFVASAGAAFGFVISNKTTYSIRYFDETESEVASRLSKHFGQFTISPQLSIGADYQISPRFNIRLEPIARYAFLIRKVSPARTNLISGGLQFSLLVAL